MGDKPFQAGDFESARAVVEALGYRVDNVARQAWADYAHLNLEQVRLDGELAPDNAPPLTVSELKTRRTTSRPQAPFTTASLQQAASNALRFSASRTMRTAQSLYEGIDLNGEGAVGLITYMRTDSTNLAGDAVNAARNFIKGEFGDKYLPEKPNVYGKRQARTQEAHEAIRPTDPARTPASLRQALTKRTVQAVRADLETVRGLPDAARRVGFDVGERHV